MRRRLRTPQSLIGFGTLIFSIGMFFAQGGFTTMNLLWIIAMVIGGALIIWGLVKKPESTRIKELQRLVLQVQNAAGRVVLYHHAIGDTTEEVMEAYKAYDEASRALRVEADVEGGEIKEVIGEFDLYINTHVGCFLGIFKTAGKDIVRNIDENQFVGQMPSRADKVIQVIQKALK